MSEPFRPNYFAPDVEKATDVLDIASQVEQQSRDAQINQLRQQAAPEKDHRFDGLHCVEEDCGVEIPAARLAHGKVRCVDCQRILEAERNQRR